MNMIDPIWIFLGAITGYAATIDRRLRKIEAELAALKNKPTSP
jgi:hypothetical protein